MLSIARPSLARVVVLLLAGVLGLAPCLDGPPALLAQTESSWHFETSGTRQMLWSITCPGPLRCFAAGDGGVIVATTDGGVTWVAQHSGTTRSFSGVACPTKAICYAAGGEPTQVNQGVIVATRDGGRNWVNQPYGTGSISLFDIACPAKTACFAVGARGTILATTNGGRLWQTQRSGTKEDLNGISCPSASICYAVGGLQQNCSQRPAPCNPSIGIALVTHNAGRTWRTVWKTSLLIRISCPRVKTCVTVGSVIGFTSDGGQSWGIPSTQPDDFLGHPWPVQDVSCPSRSVCYGVQWPAMPGGSILVTANGAHTWTTAWNGSPQVSLNGFRGITCPNTTTCYAVGWNGSIVAGTYLPAVPQ